jgi:hypothetical protein
MAPHNKKRENMFMKKLLAGTAADLLMLYTRKNNFASGKSLDYCTIGELKITRLRRVNELKHPDSAFRLGLEFGINLGIDAFNAVSSATAQKVSSTLLPKGVTKKMQARKKTSTK